MKTHYYRWAVRIRVRQDGAWGVPFLQPIVPTWAGACSPLLYDTRALARRGAHGVREEWPSFVGCPVYASAVKVRVTVERVP